MDTNKMIEELRQEAKKNQVWNDVACVLATRERARHSLTLSGLMQHMKKEGFFYPVSQYREILELLARVGIGILDKDPKNRVRGVKGIKINIQSLGAAVCNGTDDLKSFKQRPRYQRVDKPAVLQEDVQYNRLKTGIMLTILINGKPVSIPMPKDLSSKDIADFINTIKKD